MKKDFFKKPVNLLSFGIILIAGFYLFFNLPKAQALWPFEPKPKRASVWVWSNVSNAIVTIDDHKYAKGTPIWDCFPFHNDPQKDTYRIKLEKEGYKTLETTFQITEGGNELDCTKNPETILSYTLEKGEEPPPIPDPEGDPIGSASGGVTADPNIPDDCARNIYVEVKTYANEVAIVDIKWDPPKDTEYLFFTELLRGEGELPLTIRYETIATIKPDEKTAYQDKVRTGKKYHYKTDTDYTAGSGGCQGDIVTVDLTDPENPAVKGIIMWSPPGGADEEESKCVETACNVEGVCGRIGTGFNFKCIFCKIGCFIYDFVGSFVNWTIDVLNKAAGISQNFFVEKAWAAEENTLSDQLKSDQVQTAWRYSLTVVDIIVIFALLTIAFANILKLNIDIYAVKKALPGLLIGVILANFSLLICRVIVDFASLLSTNFLDTAVEFIRRAKEHGVIDPAVPADRSSIGSALASLMGISPTGTGVVAMVGTGGLLAILGFSSLPGIGCLIALAALLFLFLPSLLILALSFLLYIRLYVIWILTILSPLGFVILGFPPAQQYFKTWWSWFLKWVFLGPIVYFFIGLAAVFGGVTWWATSDKKLSFFCGWILGMVVLGMAIYVPFVLGGKLMRMWGALGAKAVAGVGRRADVMWYRATEKWPSLQMKIGGKKRAWSPLGLGRGWLTEAQMREEERMAKATGVGAELRSTTVGGLRARIAKGHGLFGLGRGPRREYPELFEMGIDEKRVREILTRDEPITERDIRLMELAKAGIDKEEAKRLLYAGSETADRVVMRFHMYAGGFDRLYKKTGGTHITPETHDLFTIASRRSHRVRGREGTKIFPWLEYDEEEGGYKFKQDVYEKATKGEIAPLTHRDVMRSPTEVYDWATDWERTIAVQGNDKLAQELDYADANKLAEKFGHKSADAYARAIGKESAAAARAMDHREFLDPIATYEPGDPVYSLAGVKIGTAGEGPFKHLAGNLKLDADIKERMRRFVFMNKTKKLRDRLTTSEHTGPQLLAAMRYYGELAELDEYKDVLLPTKQEAEGWGEEEAPPTPSAPTRPPSPRRPSGGGAAARPPGAAEAPGAPRPPTGLVAAARRSLRNLGLGWDDAMYERFATTLTGDSGDFSATRALLDRYQGIGYLSDAQRSSLTPERLARLKGTLR